MLCVFAISMSLIIIYVLFYFLKLIYCVLFLFLGSFENGPLRVEISWEEEKKYSFENGSGAFAGNPVHPKD